MVTLMVVMMMTMMAFGRCVSHEHLTHGAWSEVAPRQFTSCYISGVLLLHVIQILLVHTSEVLGMYKT